MLMMLMMNQSIGNLKSAISSNATARTTIGVTCYDIDDDDGDVDDGDDCGV